LLVFIIASPVSCMKFVAVVQSAGTLHRISQVYGSMLSTDRLCMIMANYSPRV
jgi:hypothetical protein